MAESRKPKEPSYRQYVVTVYVAADVGDDTPDAHPAGALDRVWKEWESSTGRFRVTRAEHTGTAWWDGGGDPAEEPGDYDRLRFVCDYVAKGANANDARTKIQKVIESTGITVLHIDAQETASLRAAEPFPVTEDLPSRDELLRRASL